MIEFKDMPSHSRVWIYQSNREFTASEVELLRKKSEEFISQWTSHDQFMKACIEIFYSRFIVVCVDEKTVPASGCGIDKSIKFIQQLESALGGSVSLMDRTNVAYRTPVLNPVELKPYSNMVKGEIQICSINELKKISSTENLIVFNNLVQTKEELEKNWEVPIEKSWHKQFFT